MFCSCGAVCCHFLPSSQGGALCVILSSPIEAKGGGPLAACMVRDATLPRYVIGVGDLRSCSGIRPCYVIFVVGMPGLLYVMLVMEGGKMKV